MTWMAYFEIELLYFKY